jgi:20S proteasome alpha/beta subunit
VAGRRVGEKSVYPPLALEDAATGPAHFSKGGRLLQIEYARECPQSGPLAVAMRLRSGVLLAKGKATKPELGFRIPLVWPISRSLAYVANGNLGDMFYLQDVLATKGPDSFDEAAHVIRGTLHDHAVRNDVRPLALLILLGGIHRGKPQLAGFDVTGSQFTCDAWAFGQGDLRARNRLVGFWKEGLSETSGRDLATNIYRAQPHEVSIVRRL